jgi:hypothetical protein
LSPEVEAQTLDGALMVASGNALTVTASGCEVALQPLAFVTVTE